MKHTPTRGCPFCGRIEAGDVEHTWHSTAGTVVAFTPHHPVVPGHLLFVPEVHVVDAADAPDVTALTMGRAAAYLAELGVDAHLIANVGPDADQTVFHLHIHLVPRVRGDGVTMPWTGQRREATA
ncbi:HIT family protein [Cryptosporangium aurantiacum]|uniref:Histidine triad (HIT) family protein n=1 Tax=Cryptosporangium aurantiacum TaxID=134849 RepID=A0A1M7RPT5_9ACTN|nr:HIT family protein [Cryptosporangium aurantiacum]SHN48190.1 histidine triad (HIT) family protein [Cryptosporangium aurantiacum]